MAETVYVLCFLTSVIVAALLLQDDEHAEKLVERLKPKLDENRLTHNTVEERKRDLGRSMDNLYSFLNLVGFIALLPWMISQWLNYATGLLGDLTRYVR